ncbi:MAG: hypothetical protein ACI8PQ_003404, partial [Planctomycetota bacterium]
WCTQSFPSGARCVDPPETLGKQARTPDLTLHRLCAGLAAVFVQGRDTRASGTRRIYIPEKYA